jgi:outer membrane protein TolC
VSYLLGTAEKKEGVTRKGALFASALAALILAGCSLHPAPITPEQQKKLIVTDQKLLFASQKPVTKSITLYDAMARAIKYNLNHRLKRMEEALSHEQLQVANWDTLPRLAMQAGYSQRDSQNASVSKNLTTGATATDYSTSQNNKSRVADLTFTWNLLDFGVSYFQAKQEADRTLIANENRRKALHNLMEEVRFAYWKAVGAQQLENETVAVLNAAKGALVLARTTEREDLRSPIISLRYQLDLMNAVRQLEKVQAELLMARTDLAVLINLDPSADFRLEDTSGETKPGPLLNLSLKEMEEMALMQRPELRVEHYQTRINAVETRKAMLRSMPGLEFNLGKK